ncbi:hypothetical protein B484DRAFT_412092 [Ochromonadaceae sp. CCMP2298]|nr:hypothetical protein B484DRAFT_412092 [Ochromonadaceae sp. CCMP2298]
MQVCTMFMSWDSYSSSKHRDLTSLQPIFYRVQEILEQKGAFIRQFLVDDKGCVLVSFSKSGQSGL